MLNFTSAASAIYQGLFEKGNKTIVLSGLHCDGNENLFTDCDYKELLMQNNGTFYFEGNQSCSNYEEAGLVCTPEGML